MNEDSKKAIAAIKAIPPEELELALFNIGILSFDQLSEEALELKKINDQYDFVVRTLERSRN